MIPKADAYVYETLKKYIEKVIATIGTDDERYIIREAIGNTMINGDDSIADTFINSFSGANKSKIEFSYAFPTHKENLDARYVIMRGAGEESTASIGNLVGEHDNERPQGGENEQVDSCKVLKDDAGYYFELTLPIAELITIDQVSSENFVDWEANDSDPKRINLTDLAADFLGATFNVSYIVADSGYRKDYGGVDAGFTFKEKVMIQAISNNVNTARCLDSILKYVLIIMRKSHREGNTYQLSEIESQGEQLLDMKLERPIYAFPTIVTYLNTYSVTTDSADRFKEILIKDDENNGR